MRATSRLLLRVGSRLPQEHSCSTLAEQNEALQRELERLRHELDSVKKLSATTGERSVFVGAKGVYTADMKFYDPNTDVTPTVLPVFRLMDDVGRIVPDAAPGAVPNLSREEALAMMATMVRVQEFDKVFLDAQRQGRVPFYLTSRGEEAASVGSAAALNPDDWMLPQYREMGAMFWRGFSFEEVANQLVANGEDTAHGRQLGMHLGSKSKHVVSISSPLGTQCPQAAGIAFAMKMMSRPQVAVTYFGEGCASEGDIPSALNIAAVHGCPTIFFCRNNGYAISTNSGEQYAGDGVAPRGLAFGLPTIRVDGNDILAVLTATREARRIGLRENRPTLIEAMTYRIGAHSTSDDDSKYRQPDAPEEGWDSERAYWEARSPIIRLGRYLAAEGWWNPQMEDHARKEARSEAIASLNDAQQVCPGAPSPP